MRPRFVVEPEAEAELNDAFDWYESRVRRFPYAIYFVLDSDHISVIACIHTRRNPRRWQSRR